MQSCCPTAPLSVMREDLSARVQVAEESIARLAGLDRKR
jgi:hypothetical protein